jgi:formyl-CoA transferase
MYAYSGILTALYTRAVTGQARAVEVSLFEALAEWMGQPAYYTRYGGTQPPRIGTQHATIAPYTAADGRQVLLSIQNEREWSSLCDNFLQRPDLAADPRFATGVNRALAPPADLTGVTPRMDPVPAVGEHTERILTALGRDPAAIAALRADGII